MDAGSVIPGSKAHSAEQSGIRNIIHINHKGGYCYAKNINQLSDVSQRLC